MSTPTATATAADGGDGAHAAGRADDVVEPTPRTSGHPRPSYGRASGGRMSAAGVPMEKSLALGASSKRLLRRMGPDRPMLGAVVAPRRGQRHAGGARAEGARPRHRHHRGRGAAAAASTSRPSTVTLLLAAALYVGRPRWRGSRPTLLAGIVQRTMYRLRSDVEAKLNALPLSYLDRQHRGDLLSRVTNDIDNLAQSLQQSLSQLLTSVLTIVGVVIMMVSISPLLAVVALVTVPLSLFTIKTIAKRAQPRFVAQWRHTGMLNAQVEEAFTGHALVKAFGRQREVEARFAATNDELYQASFGAQFVSGIIQPAMMFIGNLNFVDHRRRRWPAGRGRRHDHRRHPGLHPVLAAVHPAAHPDGVDGQRAAVGHRLRRADLRAARRARAARRRRHAGAGRPQPTRPRRVRARLVLLQPRHAAHPRPVPGRRAGLDRGHRRAPPARARRRSST